MITRVLVVSLCAATAAVAQQTAKPPSPLRAGTPKPPAVVKLSANTFRIGEMTVDTAARTLVIAGTVNDVQVLEFVANTVNSVKAYESALTLNTNAVSFNAALLVLGLDPARSKPSSRQFDPEAPQGDPVEITVTWNAGGKARTEPIEELLFDERSKRTLPRGPWVYTGSRFIDTGEYRFYLAEADGVLIGFMHGPQSIIDNPRADAIGGYNFYVLNPGLGLKAGTAVTVTVKSLNKTK